MEEFKKILVLENEIEAQVLGAILDEQEIPHLIRSYHDSVYNGIYQAQKGWGRVDAPEEFRETIIEIYANLPAEEVKSEE